MTVLLYSLILALGSEILLTLINIICGIYTIVHRRRSKENEKNQSTSTESNKKPLKVKIRNNQFRVFGFHPEAKKNSGRTIINMKRNKKQHMHVNLKNFYLNLTNSKIAQSKMNQSKPNSPKRNLNLKGNELLTSSECYSMRFSNIGANNPTKKIEGNQSIQPKFKFKARKKDKRKYELKRNSSKFSKSKSKKRNSHFSKSKNRLSYLSISTPPKTKQSNSNTNSNVSGPGETISFNSELQIRQISRKSPNHRHKSLKELNVDSEKTVNILERSRLIEKRSKRYKSNKWLTMRNDSLDLV